MEIFSKEFKIELSNQLEALTNLVKTDEPKQMSDLEIKESMEDCFDNLDCGKKQKNVKFKAYDIVYFGNLKGNVLMQANDDSDISLQVYFTNNKNLSFTKDGRFYKDMPVILSHYPYEFKMKKIK
jgi:hypothetical protein